MILHFDITEVKDTPYGTFLTGSFTEKPPYFASNQILKMGKYEFEIWGMPKDNVWTLQLTTDGEFNEALEEQIVQLEIL